MEGQAQGTGVWVCVERGEMQNIFSCMVVGVLPGCVYSIYLCPHTLHCQLPPPLPLLLLQQLPSFTPESPHPQYPDPNDYSQFMAQFSSLTGIVTFSMMLLSRWIFSRFGAGTAALITPVVLLVTGVLFFGCVLAGNALQPVLAVVHMTPLMAAVMVGAAQNIFSKASKYSLFDPFKEMAYIPLDPDTQLKGKAAIDVVCSPLGKSGGSLVQQALILTFGSLAASTPALVWCRC